jgi:hypothetical protein
MMFSMTHPPKTDSDGYEMVLQIVSKSDLARYLKVSKQLISRWKSVPVHYAVAVADLTKLPLSYVMPDLDREVGSLLNRPPEKLLPDLIRILTHRGSNGITEPAIEPETPAIPRKRKYKKRASE